MTAYANTIEDLTKREAELRSAYEAECVKFKKSVQPYLEVEKKLKETIRSVLRKYCSVFGDLQEQAKNHGVRLEAVVISDYPLNYYGGKLSQCEDIHPLADPTPYGYPLSFKQDRFSFYLAIGPHGQDDDDIMDSRSVIIIPTRFMKNDGLIQMQKEANQIADELAVLDAEKRKQSLRSKF